MEGCLGTIIDGKQTYLKNIVRACSAHIVLVPVSVLDVGIFPPRIGPKQGEEVTKF